MTAPTAEETVRAVQTLGDDTWEGLGNGKGKGSGVGRVGAEIRLRRRTALCNFVQQFR